MFLQVRSKPHPNSSQLILKTPKALSTFLDPKSLVFTFIWRSSLWFGFRVRLGPNLNCIVVFGVACAREGTLGVVGDHRSHMIESRTPSH